MHNTTSCKKGGTHTSIYLSIIISIHVRGTTHLSGRIQHVRQARSGGAATRRGISPNSTNVRNNNN